MTNQTEAFDKIKEALELTTPGLAQKVTMETHLVDDDVLDSLDLMNFMFELEELHGSKLEQISESFVDYNISTLVGFMTEA